MIRVKQSFSNWIDQKSIAKKDNSGAFLLSAVFGTHEHVDYRMVFWSKTF